MSEITVARNPDESRWEAHLDGELASFVRYQVADDVITLHHTETLDGFGGKGVASKLARGTLDQIRAEGNLRVRALCPFIAGWIEKHPDYQDLLIENEE